MNSSRLENFGAAIGFNAISAAGGIVATYLISKSVPGALIAGYAAIAAMASMVAALATMRLDFAVSKAETPKKARSLSRRSTVVALIVIAASITLVYSLEVRNAINIFLVASLAACMTANTITRPFFYSFTSTTSSVLVAITAQSVCVAGLLIWAEDIKVPQLAVLFAISYFLPALMVLFWRVEQPDRSDSYELTRVPEDVTSFASNIGDTIKATLEKFVNVAMRQLPYVVLEHSYPSLSAILFVASRYCSAPSILLSRAFVHVSTRQHHSNSSNRTLILGWRWFLLAGIALSGAVLVLINAQGWELKVITLSTVLLLSMISVTRVLVSLHLGFLISRNRWNEILGATLVGFTLSLVGFFIDTNLQLDLSIGVSFQTLYYLGLLLWLRNKESPNV